MTATTRRPRPSRSSPPSATLDLDTAAVVALATLPYLAWDAITRLLHGIAPAAAWEHVVAGGAGEALQAAACRVAPVAVLAAHHDAGIGVARLGDASFPPSLADDPEPPPVVFWRGDFAALDVPRVAIVGTRRSTHYGRSVARQLGNELAAAGVCVVSGLAAGIDGAAHHGALAAKAAPPAGVVGSGLDVVYPRHHAQLWADVAAAGLLLSEAPLGARPEPWRFPARNRIIAALADVLVVVESHAAGGSMHTVRAAADRSVPVLAVPGPVRSPASAGTNLLLSQGCHPACDTDDVLTALALVTAGTPRRPAPAPTMQGLAPEDGRPTPAPRHATVLDAVDWAPTAFEDVLARTGLPAPDVSAALAWLVRAQWVTGAGGWWERC